MKWLGGYPLVDGPITPMDKFVAHFIHAVTKIKHNYVNGSTVIQVIVSSEIIWLGQIKIIRWSIRVHLHQGTLWLNGLIINSNTEKALFDE